MDSRRVFSFSMTSFGAFLTKFLYTKGHFSFMVDLGDEELNKKLKKLKKQDIPSVDKIEKRNKKLEEEEESFSRKFFKKRVKRK